MLLLRPLRMPFGNTDVPPAITGIHVHRARSPSRPVAHGYAHLDLEAYLSDLALEFHITEDGTGVHVFDP